MIRYSKIVHSIITAIDDGIAPALAIRCHFTDKKELEHFLEWCKANKIYTITDIYLGGDNGRKNINRSGQA